METLFEPGGVERVKRAVAGGDPLRADPHMAVFSSLSDKELQEFAKIAEETTVAKGDKLTKAGTSSYRLFAIEDGSVEVRRDDETVATLGAGDVVGEAGIIGRGLRNADVVARCPASTRSSRRSSRSATARTPGRRGRRGAEAARGARAQGPLGARRAVCGQAVGRS